MEFRFCATRSAIGTEYVEEEWKEWNRKNVRDYLSKDLEESIVVSNNVRELQFEYRWPKFELPLFYFLKDLKDESSCLYKFYISDAKEEDRIEKQVDVFIDFFNALVKQDWTVIGVIDNKSKYAGFVSLVDGRLIFKVWFDDAYLDEKFQDKPRLYGYVKGFDITEFSPEEILTRIAPAYYFEIGMHDRGPLRENLQVMDELSKCWIHNTEFKLD